MFTYWQWDTGATVVNVFGKCVLVCDNSMYYRHRRNACDNTERKSSVFHSSEIFSKYKPAPLSHAEKFTTAESIVPPWNPIIIRYTWIFYPSITKLIQYVDTPRRRRKTALVGLFTRVAFDEMRNPKFLLVAEETSFGWSNKTRLFMSKMRWDVFLPSMICGQLTNPRYQFTGRYIHTYARK